MSNPGEVKISFFELLQGINQACGAIQLMAGNMAVTGELFHSIGDVKGRTAEVSAEIVGNHKRVMRSAFRPLYEVMEQFAGYIEANDAMNDDTAEAIDGAFKHVKKLAKLFKDAPGEQVV